MTGGEDLIGPGRPVGVEAAGDSASNTIAGSTHVVSPGPAVEVVHLRKTYGSNVAVDDVSFSVTEGEIFGILGPNGAGKTTTVEWVLGAQLVIQAGIAATALVILLVVGTAGFGMKTPASLGGLILAVVLSVTAVFAVGLWITGVARTAVSAGAISWALFFLLMFFAGLWVPRQEFPIALRDVSDLTPLGASVEALQHAMQIRFPSATSLLVLGAYAALFTWLAVRFFRWE